MIDYAESTMLTVVVPLTVIAFLIVMACHISKSSRQSKHEQEEAALAASSTTVTGSTITLPWMAMAASAATAIPMVLTLAIALLTDVSMTVANLAAGSALAYLIGVCSIMVWHKLRSGSADTIIVIGPLPPLPENRSGDGSVPWPQPPTPGTVTPPVSDYDYAKVTTTVRVLNSEDFRRSATNAGQS